MTIDFTKEHIKSLVKVNQCTENLKFLLFVGHAHSGHSLIGALIDAHPLAMVANEVNIVKSINEHKLNKRQTINLLTYAYLHNKGGWENSEYRYNLTDTYQGIIEEPKLIGDKKAGGSTRIFFKNPMLFDYILKEFGSNLRIVYVQRNAIDIIASYSYYMKQSPSMFHVNRFNENLETVQNIKSKTPEAQFLTIIQEEFVNQPYENMMTIYKFLGLNTEGLQTKIKSWIGFVRPNLPKKSDYIKININLRNKIRPT